MELKDPNICGVFVASVNMLVKGLAEIWGESERSIIITRTCYFAVATIYVVVCVLTYIALRRLKKEDVASPHLELQLNERVQMSGAWWNGSAELPEYEFVRYYLSLKGSDNVEEIDAVHEATTLVTKNSPEDAEDKTEEGLVATCSPRDFVESQMLNDKTDEVEDDAGISAWDTLRNCFALCCFAGAEGRKLCGTYWRRYKKTFRECWLQCLTVWMVFVCTLALFPSVQSTIKPSDPSYIIKDFANLNLPNESWFVDITCFFFFNLFALLGCTVSNWVRFELQLLQPCGICMKESKVLSLNDVSFIMKINYPEFQLQMLTPQDSNMFRVDWLVDRFESRPGPRFLWVPVLLRLIFFVPFFLLSNYRIDGRVADRRMPLWITNDHIYVFGSIVFAFTSGYFSSLAMMYAPMRSPPERAGLAGLLASFFLIFGVFSGCNLTRLLMAFL
ncbi:hypothetical protein ACTXT7_004960 [Hymenolepis weldensis]